MIGMVTFLVSVVSVLMFVSFICGWNAGVAKIEEKAIKRGDAEYRINPTTGVSWIHYHKGKGYEEK